MKKKKNDLTEDVKAFFDVTTDVGHLLLFVPWLHKMAEPTLRKSNEILAKRGAPQNSFGPGSATCIVDIFHDGEYVTRAPVASRITRGKQVMELAVEVEDRYFSLTLTILHESWETYVKHIYGKMLFHLRGELPPPKRASFHAKHNDWRTYKDTPAYCSDYASWSCRRGCAEAMRVFATELDWSTVHITSWLGMEWNDIVRLLAFCRHQIVHDDGRVSEPSWANLRKNQAAFVRKMMKKSILSGEECIRPDREQLDRMVEAMMSYAYGLYVLVSIRCGLDVDYDPKKMKVAAKRG